MGGKSLTNDAGGAGCIPRVVNLVHVSLEKCSIGVFTIGQSDAFLSDYLADLKLHSTK